MGFYWKLLVIWALGCGLLVGPTVMPSEADDHGHHKSHEKRQLAVPENLLHRERCGRCHIPYPPGLLPAASWRNALATQSNHFGEDLALGQAEIQQLAVYLEANAADRSSAKISRKIVKSLGGHNPVRITEIPYIIHKHKDDDVPKGVFLRKSVGSFANCGACHPGALAGDFDDDNVRIPAE